MEMKNLTLSFVCLLLVTSCGFENLPPRSITIKGNPGLYVPLGSPFASLDEDQKLEYLISTENLKKMMNDNVTEAGADDEVKIYEVSKRLAGELGVDPEARTYLVHYPLIEMPLNLRKYADDAMEGVKTKREINIPSIPTGSQFPLYINDKIVNGEHVPVLAAAEDRLNPFIKIPFSKMAKLVKKIENGKYGLEIAYTQDLANNLELKIPGFGINDYMKGIPAENNTKLQYYATAPAKTDFYPQAQVDIVSTPSDLDDGTNLYIYARISGACPGKLEPSMIFEWDSALIDTKAAGNDISTFKGDYPIKNSLSEFLGKGVTFKKVDGYMYMSGVEEGKASMMTAIYDTEKFNNGHRDPDKDAEKIIRDRLRNVEMPLFQGSNEFDGKINPMSLSKGPLDLRGLLESSDRTLQFAITIEEMEYKNKPGNDETSIKFDLLILLPMDMEISTEIPQTDTNAEIRQKYVMLDFGDSFKKDLWEGDLFGRKPGDENNYLKQIEYINIGIFKTNINILEKEKLAVWAATGKEGSLLKFEDNASIKLASSGEFLYSPKFTVLLEKDTGKKFGSLKILRPENPSFDFKLYVEAKAKLEYTNKF